MSSPEHCWRGAAPAELSWTAGEEPRSTHFSDVYYTAGSGLEESRYVFLEGNHLPERWHTLESERFTVAETGFGTGLNFLASWQAWRKAAPAGKRLHYLSIEAYPLDRADLARALKAWPELADLADSLLANYPPALPGLHRLLFEGGNVCLDLLIGDISVALQQLSEMADLQVNAWFLDGFAPSNNPGMWSTDLYQTMARTTAPACSFASFTAAGDVRRGLQAAGFAVEKFAGFGHKREMIRGDLLDASAAAQPSRTPWHLPAYRYCTHNTGPVSLRAVEQDQDRTAVIIGAGLAGANVAAALARRGWTLKVLEQGQTADGASGNPQGALYTRLSHRPSELNSFSVHSFCFASRLYREMFSEGELQTGIDGELCGALHLKPQWNSEDPLFEVVESLPRLVRALGSDAAAAASGLKSCGGGLFFPDSGWLSPAAVCRALLQRPGIELQENCGPLQLQREASGWSVIDASGEQLASAAVLVIACGASSNHFAELDWLKLQSIRGQTTQLESHGALAALKTVICHEGYIPPAQAGKHCIGATFDIDDPDSDTRPEDHDRNIQQLARALPELEQELNAHRDDQLSGRVGFRCASPDYLPIVGPVPDFSNFCEDYAELRRNARQLLPRAGSYLPGLYLSTAHGSRGLTSTPLAAEMLASEIAAEPRPLDAALCRALSPARFIIRDLARNRL